MRRIGHSPLHKWIQPALSLRQECWLEESTVYPPARHRKPTRVQPTRSILDCSSLNRNSRLCRLTSAESKGDDAISLRHGCAQFVFYEFEFEISSPTSTTDTNHKITNTHNHESRITNAVQYCISLLEPKPSADFSFRHSAKLVFWTTPIPL